MRAQNRVRTQKRLTGSTRPRPPARRSDDSLQPEDLEPVLLQLAFFLGYAVRAHDVVRVALRGDSLNVDLLAQLHSGIVLVRFSVLASRDSSASCTARPSSSPTRQIFSEMHAMPLRFLSSRTLPVSDSGRRTRFGSTAPHREPRLDGCPTGHGSLWQTQEDATRDPLKESRSMT